MNDELRVSRCDDCGAHQHLAPSRCRVCLSPRLGWVSVDGRGRIASSTVVHRAPSAPFRNVTPYVLALVDLDVGCRVMARVDAPVDAVAVGAAVRVAFVDGPDGRRQPIFRLAP